MEKECILNRERQGLRISVKSSLSSLQIKESLVAAEKAAPYVYIPGELTKEPEGYCVHIRQKISLKDYLLEEPIDEAVVYCLLYSLQELWKKAEKENLRFYNFLFDYDAVFADNLADHMEFVYLPGARLNRYNNSVKDMIVLLLIQCSPSDVVTMDYLSKIAEEIGYWEEGEGPFPEFLISILPERKKAHGKLFRILPEWRPFAVTVSVAFMLAVWLFVFINSNIVWPVWMVFSVTAILWTSPLQKKRICIARNFYLKDGPEINKEEITVGRDNNWADFYIGNLMISRRHAVIIKKEESLAVRDLFSTNGTYVDGRRLEEGEEVDLRPGQIIGFGEQCSFCVKSRKKIILK